MSDPSSKPMLRVTVPQPSVSQVRAALEQVVLRSFEVPKTFWELLIYKDLHVSAGRLIDLAAPARKDVRRVVVNFGEGVTESHDVDPVLLGEADKRMLLHDLTRENKQFTREQLSAAIEIYGKLSLRELVCEYDRLRVRAYIVERSRYIREASRAAKLVDSQCSLLTLTIEKNNIAFAATQQKQQPKERYIDLMESEKNREHYLDLMNQLKAEGFTYPVADRAASKRLIIDVNPNLEPYDFNFWVDKDTGAKVPVDSWYKKPEDPFLDAWKKEPKSRTAEYFLLARSVYDDHVRDLKPQLEYCLVSHMTLEGVADELRDKDVLELFEALMVYQGMLVEQERERQRKLKSRLKVTVTFPGLEKQKEHEQILKDITPDFDKKVLYLKSMGLNEEEIWQRVNIIWNLGEDSDLWRGRIRLLLRGEAAEEITLEPNLNPPYNLTLKEEFDEYLTIAIVSSLTDQQIIHQLTEVEVNSLYQPRFADLYQNSVKKLGVEIGHARDKYVMNLDQAKKEVQSKFLKRAGYLLDYCLRTGEDTWNIMAKEPKWNILLTGPNGEEWKTILNNFQRGDTNK